MHGQHNIKICVCVCVCVCCWCICSVACVCVRMIAIVLSYRQTTLPSRFWALSRLVAKKLCPLCVPALLPLNGFPRNLALGDFFFYESQSTSSKFRQNRTKLLATLHEDTRPLLSLRSVWNILQPYNVAKGTLFFFFFAFPWQHRALFTVDSYASQQQ